MTKVAPTRAGTRGRGKRDKRARLLAAIGSLQESGDCSPSRRLALAEAEFRLAVLPDTEPAEGIERLRKAIAHDPLHPKFFFHLGRLLHRSGDCRGAVLGYRHALKLAPGSHRACVHLALALCELEEPEKRLGRELLEALLRGQPTRELLPQVDELIRAYLAEPGAKRPQAAPRKPKPGGKPAEPTEPCRWNGIWRVSLAEQMSREKQIRKQVDECLTRGAGLAEKRGAVAEYAMSCLHLLLGGEPARAVAEMLNGPGLQPHAGSPAVRLVLAAASLAEMKEPAEFVTTAAAAVENGELPADLICALHYLNFGPEARPDGAAEALAILRQYPPSLWKQRGFTELRIAVLDSHARKAWADGQFDKARLLWREAAALDPYRIATAHNLALLAARARSLDDYAAVWTRAAELRYLQAAAAGDILIGLEERRTLHLSFTQQSQQRYCSATTSEEEQEKQIQSWVRDRDAIDVYLREWDLYYLNSRLRFRSPLHRLGIPRDASPEVTASARDALLRQIEASLESLPWAGVKTFAELARRAVLEAFERASVNVARARDPHYEQEKPESDQLAVEAIARAKLLNDLIVALGRTESAHRLRTGCAMGRRLFALPWKVLGPICARRGMTRPDQSVVEIFETNFLGLFATDRSEPKNDKEVTERLAALEECFAVVPHRTEEIGIIRHNFAALVDNAALSGFPERLLRPGNLQEAEETLREGRKALARFPRAGAVRAMLAQLMIQIGDRPHIDEAVRLLTQGLKLALHEDQTKQFTELLEKAQGQAGKAEALAEIRRLLEGASKSVGQAIEELNRSATPESVERARNTAEGAIQQAETAGRLAREAHIPDAENQASELASQCREIVKKLRGR